MKEFKCNENCELFKGNCGKHHIDWQGHIAWDCPHEQYYTGVIGDVPSCFRPSKEFKEKQRLNKQITIGEMESILDKIRAELQDIAFDWQEIDGEHESFMVVDLNDALNIIDKYKAKSEEKK